MSSPVNPPTVYSEPAPSPAAPLRRDCFWYAIRVRSKFENIACATLSDKGYETFLPLYRSRRRWSDRVKELDLPLFPSYLFCRFNVQDRLSAHPHHSLRDRDCGSRQDTRPR